MMKFVLQSIRNGCRLGILSESRLAKDLETPLCMVYSRAGCIPYLTHDMLDRIEGLPNIVQMPSNLLLEHVDTLKEYGKGIGKFTALENFLIYFHIQDSAEMIPKGYNDTTGVAVFGQGGKKMLNAQRFMDAVEAIKPDWFQALADSDTDCDSSKKRIRKSVERTLNYLDQCIIRKDVSNNLKNIPLIGVIEGGHSINDRIYSAVETAKRPVAGFSLEGFHNFGTNTNNFKISDIEEILKVTLKELPDNKPRFLPGAYNPLEIIRAIRLGCDIFDSTYPYMVTERDCASVFSLNLQKEQDTTCQSSEETMEICLKNKEYQDCFQPLLKNCSCYTCSTYTAAYVHHLICTSELLGKILLMVHNFHHYFRFFETVRTAIAADRLDAYEEHLAKINVSVAPEKPSFTTDSNHVTN